MKKEICEKCRHCLTCMCFDVEFEDCKIIERLREVAKPETEREKAEALAREARRAASLMTDEVDPEIADIINKTNILDLL